MLAYGPHAGDWRAAIAAWQDCPSDAANLAEAHFRAAAQLLQEAGERAQPQARRHLQPNQTRASYYRALLDTQAGSPDSALEFLTVPGSRNAYARGLVLCQMGGHRGLQQLRCRDKRPKCREFSSSNQIKIAYR